MALIRFENVALNYPVRANKGMLLKEFLLTGSFRKSRTTYVPALRDVTFTVCEGDRLGIIGYNGAGKSTLLKTIGGVYPISGGTRSIKGSICSLFEIGMGFEMESNGYDNIHFRSYLQGETPESVKDKVQEIADFSELGEFLKIPIKCYSSGMLMRLAFSVATAREPEILLLDEVFSAGDLAFQKKASARMHNFMDRAKIVVMVGHNLSFLEQFCSRVLWLHHGHVRADGPAREVIAAYVKDAENPKQAA